jgi:hypothetical protein
MFVIEFIGNGKSSRAIIKKGALTLIKQPTPAGVFAYIVNHDR